MLLSDVAIDINAPKLTSDLTLPHAQEISVAKESLREVYLVIINPVLQFYAQLPREVIVSVDEPVMNHKLAGCEPIHCFGASSTNGVSRSTLLVLSEKFVGSTGPSLFRT